MHPFRVDRRTVRVAAVWALVLGTLTSSASLLAQDTSTSATYQNGTPTVTTEVAHAKVVYVSGNDLVVKGEQGQVKHFVVPNDTKFNVDGKDLTVQQLRPGMQLTRTITTTEVPKNVETVRTISGKVWFINAPSTVILQFPDNSTKQYKIPEGQKFKVDGKERSAFALRKGMNVSATVVTETPMMVASSERSLTGSAPPPPPPAPPTPAKIDVLLIEEPVTAAPPPSDVAESKPPKLPKTASQLPLIGLVGLIFVGAGFGLKKAES